MAGITANTVDAVAKRRVSNVLEVPGHQILYPVHGSNSNVKRVTRF
ncbi:hypothetical protein V7x_42570 [Crateriforma conspicua]|uniref:Uncharacterized protein n=1 Tax=Crateriforma conspicua TaxID=2527996 RepID=A0A5C6FMZ0_9PLAN|nr:hypothetical protein V7x_42570 [Crateriforma conspicua]